MTWRCASAIFESRSEPNAVRFQVLPSLRHRSEEGYSCQFKQNASYSFPGYATRIVQTRWETTGEHGQDIGCRSFLCLASWASALHTSDELRHRVASLSHNPLRARLCFSADKH